MKFCELYKIINTYSSLAKDLNIDPNNINIRFKEASYHIGVGYVQIGIDNNIPALHVIFDLTRANYFTKGINATLGRTIDTVKDFEDFAETINLYCINLHSITDTDRIIYAKDGEALVISNKLHSSMYMDNVDFSLHHNNTDGSYSASILISFSLKNDSIICLDQV